MHADMTEKAAIVTGASRGIAALHNPDDRRRQARRHLAPPNERWPTMTASSSPNIGSRVSGLRANALAAVVMMLIQYSLGISVNLYSTLPASDHGKSLLSGFAAAVGKGPALLTLHALLGTLLLITALAALVRSLRVGATPLTALTAIALLAIVVAWLSGSAFVGNEKNGASLAMALATAVAILCYTLVVFLIGTRAESQLERAGAEMGKG